MWQGLSFLVDLDIVLCLSLHPKHFDSRTVEVEVEVELEKVLMNNVPVHENRT